MSSQLEEVGIVIKADGTVELANGMKLAAAEVKGLAGQLDEAARRLAALQTDAQRAGSGSAAMTGHLTQAGQAAQKTGSQAKDMGDAVAAGLNKGTISAGQMQNAMRMLPAQMTDIVVGLSTGQSPFMVAAQQGGQLKDMFGGIAPAAKAVGGAVLGMVTPLTVTAAAVATLVLAYQSGRAETAGFNTALILSGNYAGQTASSMASLSVEVAQMARVTRGAGADALMAAAQSGRIAASSLSGVAAAAAATAKATGAELGDTIDIFTKLAEEPAKASAKLNESMNYLSAATYQRIRDLEEQGRREEATALAVDTASKVIVDRMEAVRAQAGYLERAWSSLTGTVKGAWAAMQDIGRPTTTGDVLAGAQAALAAQRERNRSVGIKDGKVTQQMEAEVARLSQRLMREQDSAWATADMARTNKEKRAALERLDAQKKANRSAADVRKDEIEQLEKDAKLTDMKADELAKRRAAIEEKHKDPKGPKGTDTTRVDAAAQTKLDIERIKTTAESRVTANANAERLLQAQRAAGLIDERGYYDEKRRLLADTTQVQVDALKAENTRLEQQKLNTKDGLDRDREVLANKAKIAKLQADAAAEGAVLDVQATAAIKAREAALLSARQAAQDYFDTMERAQQRERQSMGLGDRQRGLDTGVAQIEERYASQRRELENNRAQLELEGKFTDSAREQYDQRLAIIREFQQKSVDSYVAHYQKLRELEGNWVYGAAEAVANYRDNAANVAEQTKTVFTNAFQGMEDALVKFARTGKLDFKSLADSIISDIIRMQTRAAMSSVMQSIMGAASGWLGDQKGMSINNTYGPQTQAGLDNLVNEIQLRPNAKGAVYTSPSLSAFSSQVYSSPQFFAFAKGAGVFAEAGPEAIMPLKRGPDGSLGVGVHGAGAGAGAVTLPVQVNVTNNGQPVSATVQQRRTDQGLQIDMVLDQLEGRMAERVATGQGSMSRAMESRYGLATAVG